MREEQSAVSNQQSAIGCQLSTCKIGSSLLMADSWLLNAPDVADS
jgi:hypothetical protein